MRSFLVAVSTPDTRWSELVWPVWAPDWVHAIRPTVETYPLWTAFGLTVCFYIVAKLTEWILLAVVSRLTAKTKTEVDDQLLDLVRKPVFFSVFFFGLSLAVAVLGLPPRFEDTTVNILATMVILSWLGAGFPGFRVVLDALGRHKDKFPLIEERTIPLFDIFSKLVLIGGASYVLLMLWQIDPTPWFASAGVIGIAVGFAARDTLANLFAGIFIIADAPYKLGDFVTLDSGERGVVTHVGIRSTRLQTRDDIEITMPNAVIANAKILNESGGRWEKERIRIRVGVAYGSDVDRVCELLTQVARCHQEVCRTPEPRVRMRGFGDSSLDFELLCWIDMPVLRGKLSHDLYMDVYKTFQLEGIEIPFPQRDVWVRRGPDDAEVSDS